MPADIPLIVIVGPTASGKSDVAQIVASGLGAHVLSADSMQVYRGMDIGTGKVLPHQMIVPHHGLDLIDPGQPFSASVFQEYGRAVVDDAACKGRTTVVCGGTGFYVRALVDDFEFPAGEQVGNPVRDKYNALLAQVGPHDLWKELQKVDPDSAAVIHENDSKRVVRAFELLAEGKSYRQQKDAFASIAQHYDAMFFGLSVDPAVLNARIDARVDKMVQDGLVSEVRTLLEGGFRKAVTAQQAIGYKEIVQYLDGCCMLEEAVVQVKTATHRYAKRQRTWFRKDGRIRWLDANEFDAQRLANQVLRVIAECEGDGACR